MGKIISGSSSLETSNGDIKVQISQGASVKVIADLSNGEIKGAYIEGSHKATTFDIGKGEATLKLSTSNGDIFIDK